MLEKGKSLLQKNRDVLSYLIFGVLTTLVNYAVYLPVYNLLHLSAAVSNMLSWVVAVAFAYLTNKPFVFQSHDWSCKTVVPELTKFVSCRIASGAMETGWVVAVAFAYLTNKPFVFQSHDWSCKTVVPELTKFVSCRIASGAMETGILFLTVDLLHWNGNVWKLVTQVLVVVLNYMASKLLVFRKKS